MLVRVQHRLKFKLKIEQNCMTLFLFLIFVSVFISLQYIPGPTVCRRVFPLDIFVPKCEYVMLVELNSGDIT